MKRKIFMTVTSGVVLLVLCSCEYALGSPSVSPQELQPTSNVFEDPETEAVVIDAFDHEQPDGSKEVNPPKGRGMRNGKQFYFPLLTHTFLLPSLSDNYGNGYNENGNQAGQDISSSPTFTEPGQVHGEPSTFSLDSTCITNQGQRGNCETFVKCYPLLYIKDEGNQSGNETGSHVSNLVNELYALSADRKCSSVVHAGTSPYSNVCCDLPKRTDDPRPQYLNTPSGNEDDEEVPTSTVHPKFTKVVNTWATCGEKQFDHKIIGGQEALPHEFPWMVSLWGKSGKHICGASLIDNNFVLTAAHCIARYTPQDVSKIRLLIGDHNIHSTMDGHHEVRSVKRIIKHKRFSIQTFVNDIALLKLDRPVPFTDKIRPICLPSGTVGTEYDPNLVVAGWGQTMYRGTSSSVLRKVLVPGVTAANCQKIYDAFSTVGITKDMLCAGATGMDSCIGDSGGGLFQLVNNRYEQVGIVSFGRECGQYPGVYTKVFSYLNWINVNRNKY